MPRLKQRTPELRERLLTAAVELLSREGVKGFTARTIAHEATTSPPALYELFGDKAGLLREVFFEGFRRLHRALDAVPETVDARGDLLALAGAYREFMLANPNLAQLMFSRPFADFDPSCSESQAGAAVRELIVGRIAGAVQVGVLQGDPLDLAHVLVALIQGFVAAESARRIGRTAAAVERRWSLAVGALLDGLG
jgi:AcrR family transcriptional regulator